MDIYLNKLFICLESNNYQEAEQNILHLTSLFSNELPTNLVDSYILMLFNEHSGLLAFVNKAVPKKAFNGAIVKTLELIYTLINNFKLKFESNIANIMKSCKFIIQGNTGSSEKQKALELLSLIFESNLKIDDFELLNIYDVLKIRVKIQESSKLVLEKLVVAIGVFVKSFSHIIPAEDEKEMLKHLLNLLSNEIAVKEEKQSSPAIAGLFKSISNYLFSFPDTQCVEKLYHCVKRFANPGNQKIKTAYKAALYLLTHHIHLFSKYVYADSKWWNNNLRYWLELGPEDCKVGMLALDTFHMELSNIFAEKYEDKDNNLFRIMLKHFQEDVMEANIKGHKMRLSIKALGYFATPSAKHITTNELSNIFVNLIQRVEHLYVNNTNTELDYLENLPDYIQTLSNYIKQLEEINEYHIISLQQVTILMIRVFPKLSKIYHNLVVDALVITMSCMQNCKIITLEDFLQSVIYQGVIWTCSHPLAIEAEITENTSYKTYLPLWKGLLHILNQIKYDKFNVDRNSRSIILTVIFDELLKTLLVLINKLNLNTKTREDSVGLTDPEAILEAVKVDDFVIFVNVVDFFADMLDTVNPEDFRKWIVMFTNQIISKSLRYPLVSGFYKLLAADLKMCDKLNYFSDSRVNKEHVQNIFESIRKFIEDMTHKMKQYKGDLQLACLQVILEAPVYIINAVNEDFASTFITLFAVGRSFLKIADLGIDTLEKWFKYLPGEKMEPFLKQVLPTLDSYLRTHSVIGSVDTSNPLLKARKTNRVLRKRRVLVETEPELLNVQRKILVFIAKLNSELCRSFVNSDIQVKPWSKTLHLKVPLQYEDCTFNLYLDKSLPRILELALYSSDRKTRFTACEMLHSSIMVVLGTSVQMGQSSEMNPLIAKIVNAVLNLACDIDTDIQQLFKPLIMQLLHWYSHPKQLGSAQTEIVLDILLEGISTPFDSTIRDLSGICIKEFVLWSRKQSTKKSFERNAYNIDYIIKRLKYFSLHPDPSKRLGAALIFNNIYTELREEDLLINKYWLDLLNIFVTNLSKVQCQDFEETDCLIQVKLALDHLLRVFIEKENLFNKTVSLDIRPSNFEGNMLKDVAEFLLKSTTSINATCREKCMEMFPKVANLVKNYDESMFINENKNLIFNAYEHELKKTPKVVDCTGIDGVNKWLNSFICLLDANIYFLAIKYCQNCAVIGKSNIFGYIDYYFQEVQLQHIKDLFKNNPNIKITTIVRENYDFLKNIVNKKILKFTMIILENINNLNHMTNTYFAGNLYLFLCNYIFDYQCLGYQKIDNNWTDSINKIITLMSTNLQSPVINSFVIIIKEYIANKSFIQTSTKMNVIPQKQRSLLSGMLLLEKSKLKQQINLSTYSHGAMNALFTELLEFREGVLYVKKLPKTVQEFCDFKIQLALEIHDEFLVLCTFLVDMRMVECVENHAITTYGSYIFDTFKETIVTHLLKAKNFEILIESFLSQLEIRVVYLFQLEILKYCQKNIKDLNPNIVDNIIDVITTKWDSLLLLFNDNVYTKITGIEFVEKLANLTKKNFRTSSVLTWVLTLINEKYDQLSEEQGFNFINQVINLLGILVGSEDLPIVRESLNKMKQNYFQNLTCTSKKIAASLTIRKLFDAAVKSQNINILIEAMDLFITIEHNIELDNNEIFKTYMKNLSAEKQLISLSLIYKQCLDNKYNYKQAVELTENLCSIIRYCRFNVFENFYKQIIVEVVEKLEMNDGEESIYVHKIISFVLIEALFLRIDTNKFSTLECPITDVLFSGKVYNGKELLQKLTKLSMNVCKQEATENNELKEVYRLYQCHAYNALISIMCNTQKDIDFYNYLFCRENKSKQDILWCKIIDCNKVYVFKEDFDELPKHKKILLNIRSELRSNKKKLIANEKSALYIESQHLFKSTLSEDICKYDFNNTTIRSQSEETEENVLEIETGEIEIELESYDLCQHECMASVCGLIKHMFDNEITPIPDADSKNLPKWVKDLRGLLLKEDTDKNIKLFLGRVIYNMRYVLKVHAQLLIGPIIKLVVDGHCGNNLNSFVIDMIIMILNEWQETELLPDEQQYPSELVKFIMNNVFSENRSKFTYNLNILKIVVEQWKNIIIIPYEFILKELEVPVKSKKLEVGIQLSAILLANNLSPWGVLIKQFAKCLSKGFDSTHRTVYKACAETLGLSLKLIANNAEYQPQLFNFKKLVCDKLNTISDSSKLAYCLEGVVNFYPEIADGFMSKITFKINSVVGTFKSIYLRIILARIEKFHEINGLLKINILELLSDVNVDVQIITLEIMLKSIDALKITQLQPILNKVCSFISSNNITTRNITYDILMSIYYKYNLSDDEMCIDVVNECKDFLLQALTENDPEVEEKIISFWSNNDHIPKEIHKRFLYLLENMYKVSAEEIYLAYTSYLLLNKLKSSPHFSDKIFDYPLHECVFVDLEIYTHWRTQHSSIRPMFTSSQDSESLTNVLRATQSSLNFEPTKSYVETQRSEYLKTTPSSLLFTAPEQSGTSFKDPNDLKISQKYKIYNRRFYKDKSKNSKFFAHEEVKKNTKREELRKDLAKKKEVDIKSYRKYRGGEFPDIEIHVSAIIVPLQVLAKLDQQIAKTLFISLFDSVLEKATDQNIFINKASSSINDIFKNSINFTPTLISALLEIALKYKKSMQFQPNIIATVCQSSGLMSIGSLLLEEYLIIGVSDTDGSSSKRGTADNDYETTHWIKLAELYKEMEEWDIVRAIFLEKLNCNETVLTAIEAESVGSWKDAKEYYSKVIQSEEDIDKKDFYYESYFKCFAELSDWDNLSKSIEETTSSENSWEQMWDQDWNQQKILPWYLTSQIRNSLVKPNMKKELLTNINSFLLNSNKSEYLNSNFSEELAFLAILNNDTNTSSVYLQTYITSFLDNWGHINPLFSSLRSKKIINMRNPLDMYIFIKENNKLNADNYQDILKTVECFWDKSSIENVSSIIQIETRNIYRNQFINLFKTTLKNKLSDEEYSESINNLNAMKFKLDMTLIDCSFNAKNFYVTKKYMQANGDLAKLDRNNRSQLYVSNYLKYNLALSKTFLLRGQQRSDEPQKYFNEALKLAELCLKNPQLKSDAVGLLSTVSHLYNITQEICKCDSTSFDAPKLKTIITNYDITTPNDVDSYGFELIKSTLTNCEKRATSSDVLRKNVADTFLKLAYFTQSKGDEKQMIYFTFKAMFYGSSEGRLLFPNLLNFDELGSTHKMFFIEQASKVPIWMFIKWIPQLLSNLDTSKIFAISHIIINISKEYPNSIIYAYRLSKEKYVFENNDFGEFGKEICKQLDVLLNLNNVLINTMLSALASISLFTNILKSALQKLKKSYLKSEQIFMKDAKAICEDLFGVQYNYRDSDSVRGLSFKRIDKYMETFLKMLKEKFNPKKIKERIEAIYAELDQIDETEMKKPNKDLGFYSPWLKNYHPTDEELEIPGQYRDNQRPLIQYHVKVAGFGSDVRIFNSLRKPIQITILGNNTREYKFLVKYGEDLRQDQRLEQLFNLMNGILNSNPECCQRKLNIVTYEVIPLTSKLGIIEWMEETTILKDFIQDGASGSMSQAEFKNLSAEYYKWISKAAPKNSSIGTIYAGVMLKYNNNEVIAKYRSFVSSVPWDAFRKSFWNISIDTESFFALRYKFISSYAVMCISNWLLGIGDRHLSNILISKENGNAIGVDFGHAFGTATQILGIPELVPFRLTPQIINLMQPYNEHGLLQESMIHTLRALRLNSNTLLATMNVFVQEPSLDWLEFADSTKDESTTDEEWYPKQKMALARKKFEGGNPCQIMIEELKTRKNDNKLLNKKYIEFAQGYEQHNIRARKGDDLSAEEQVKCLLDQATDYNLLGRMYLGWEPYI